jgi:hypothetical protein
MTLKQFASTVSAPETPKSTLTYQKGILHLAKIVNANRMKASLYTPHILRN